MGKEDKIKTSLDVESLIPTSNVGKNNTNIDQVKEETKSDSSAVLEGKKRRKNFNGDFSQFKNKDELCEFYKNQRERFYKKKGIFFLNFLIRGIKLGIEDDKIIIICNWINKKYEEFNPEILIENIGISIFEKKFFLKNNGNLSFRKVNKKIFVKQITKDKLEEYYLSNFKNFGRFHKKYDKSYIKKYFEDFLIDGLKFGIKKNMIRNLCNHIIKIDESFNLNLFIIDNNLSDNYCMLNELSSVKVIHDRKSFLKFYEKEKRNLSKRKIDFILDLFINAIKYSADDFILYSLIRIIDRLDLNFDYEQFYLSKNISITSEMKKNINDYFFLGKRDVMKTDIENYYKKNKSNFCTKKLDYFIKLYDILVSFNASKNYITKVLEYIKKFDKDFSFNRYYSVSNNKIKSFNDYLEIDFNLISFSVGDILKLELLLSQCFKNKINKTYINIVKNNILILDKNFDFEEFYLKNGIITEEIVVKHKGNLSKLQSMYYDGRKNGIDESLLTLIYSYISKLKKGGSEYGYEGVNEIGREIIIRRKKD